MSGPLDGYRIVDLTSMISGPLATMLLGDQGADVIKVEPPEGGDLVRRIGRSRAGITPIFATSNRNKRSLALDLREPGAREVVARLVAGADVLVQNFRPGAAERLGVGEAALRELRPDLIYVSISGFGEAGPYAEKRAYDPVIQALSGLASIQADRATGRPRMLRTIVPDKLTALTAAQAITAALLARERGGGGQHVRLAMLDAVIAFMWPEAMSRHTFRSAEGSESAQAGPRPLRDLVFETADGYMTAGAVSNREWAALAVALGRDEWVRDPRFATETARLVNWDERLECVGEVLKTRTTAEWLEDLDRAGVPCAPILSRRELLDDPQVAHNELILESEHPHAGPMRQPRPAARFEVTPADIRRPAPTLGEHTDEVLREIGFAQDEISRLRELSVVA